MLRLATHAMGTRFELVLADGGDEARARAVGESVLATIEECDQRFSRFRSDSWLSHLHREAWRAPVQLDDDDFELFEVCDRVHRESSGAFDPSVAPLMNALGFRDRSLEPRHSLDAARELVGWSSVELDRRRRTLFFHDARTRLDLGAVAKGHALDLAARELRRLGVEFALLHGGTSSVIALGAPPTRNAWRVALEGGDRAATVELRDEALSVSAQHGRRLADGAGHILDPRSRRPAQTDALVAVVHARALVAEAWSTALLVLGEVPCAARELDVAVGSGERFERLWQFSGRARFRFEIHASFSTQTTS